MPGQARPASIDLLRHKLKTLMYETKLKKHG